MQFLNVCSRTSGVESGTKNNGAFEIFFEQFVLEISEASACYLIDAALTEKLIERLSHAFISLLRTNYLIMCAQFIVNPPIIRGT